jgi:hypothetical protein
MTNYLHLHWKRLVILGALAFAVVLVVLFWRELLLIGVAWLGGRRLYGGKRRRRQRRPGVLESARRWIDTAALVAIARNARPPKRVEIRRRPEPVYRLPGRSSQLGPDEPLPF